MYHCESTSNNPFHNLHSTTCHIQTGHCAFSPASAWLLLPSNIGLCLCPDHEFLSLETFRDVGFGLEAGKFASFEPNGNVGHWSIYVYVVEVKMISMTFLNKVHIAGL